MGFTYGVCVIVEFPQSRVQLSHLPPKHFPVTPITWTFTTLLGNSRQKLRVVRSQLPIQPAFAVTGHSAQGKTLPKVLVNLAEGGFAAYVAASRATTRRGLCITEPVTIQQLNKPLPHNLLQEIRRLDAIEHNTMITHGFKKGALISVPDVESESLHLTPKMQIILDEKQATEKRETKRKRESEIRDTAKQDTLGDTSPHRARKQFKVPSSSPSITISPDVTASKTGGHITKLDVSLHTAYQHVNLQPTSAPIGAGCQ